MIPWSTTYKYAINFAISKTEWIKENLKIIKEIEEQERIKFIDNQQVTQWHTLKVYFEQIEKPKFRINENIINVYLPLHLKIDSESSQQIISKAVIESYRKKAKKIIPGRINEFAKKHDFQVGKIRLTSARTRWGSCSSKNNINISIHAMRLPEYLIDYIILHELAHTREKNHSKNFWSLVDELTDGKSEILRQKLKNYKIPLN